MKITSSYGIELKNINKLLLPTVKLYREAVSFCIDIFEYEWINIEPLSSLSRNSFAEHLIHSTKDNIAKYTDFDTRFYKMPTYMRRNIISTVIGYLSSYHNNLQNWYDNGCNGKKPMLQTPITPFAIIKKIKEINAFDTIEGIKVTILNRTERIGLPLAIELSKLGATVTVCNSKTSKEDLETLTYNSNIIITAMGNQDVIDYNTVNKGQIWIDCSGDIKQRYNVWVEGRE